MPRPLRGEGKTNVETHRSKRALAATCPVQPVQLTRDQKPEDTEELIRIFRCGGHVKQLVDEKGNKIGPYRVWKPNTNGPGIAMSRSIGDTIGTDLGVISDPVLTEYSMNWEADLFMICASDGIWDVMDNEDVVRYLEKYRLHCVRGTASVVGGEPVKCRNATIAQMICEEARARWYSIIEKEEVLIDDISCVVVEFRDEPGDLPDPLDFPDPPTSKDPATEPTRR